MKEERRKELCPDHAQVFVCRQDDNVICVAYGCKWKVKARRASDTKIPTLGSLKKEYNG